MATNRSTSVQVGPGLPSLLTVLFVALKLTGFIAWSWWWVFSPLWIPVAIIAVIMVVAGIVAGIAFLAALLIDKYNNRLSNKVE